MYRCFGKYISIFTFISLCFKFVWGQDIPLSDTSSFDTYRYIVYTVSATTGLTDTTIEIERIHRNVVIFRGGKVYTYRAIYINAMGDTLSNRRVWMKPTGMRWRNAHKRQTEVHYEFEGVVEDSASFTPHSLNSTFSSWKQKIATGATENEKEVWIYPIRHNQYIFTQLAPIPKVELPLEKGRTWKNTFRVRGYGKWHNQVGKLEYEVKKLKALDVDFTTSIECWEIHAKAEFPEGESSLVYYFHPYYGFVKMLYTNFFGETLDIILIDLQE